MSYILTNIFIAVALSMDAFSISVCLATSNLINRTKSIIFIILVGFLHFLMPLLGNYLGTTISINLEQIANYILAIIFLILAIEVLTSKKEECKKINFIYLIFIAVTVSLDSFTVGLGLGLTHDYSIISSIIFSITSALFTLIGITIGKKVKQHIEKKTNFIGAILLFLLSIKYFFKF